MGGDIQVRSTPGGGTQFWFELALPVSGVRQRQAAPERITGYAGPRRRILVVDDLPANRVILHEWLAPLGFEIVEAEHGAQALERVRAQPPDLVITDMLMPGMHGDELMARIHQLEALRSVPIIAMSAAIDEARLPVGVGHDACAFLPKPLDREQLLNEVGLQLALTWQREVAAGPDPTRHLAARSFLRAAPRRE
jgi:CheY-like chemotaxis protein